MFKKILISFFIGLIALLNTGVVYADFSDSASSTSNSFSASNLSLNLTDSDNNSIFYPLFYSSDLVPGASRSASFKINKDGTEDFKYNIYFFKTFGDDNLCNNLSIEAKLGNTILYDGSLGSLSIFPSPIITDGEDEWTLIVSLPDSSGELREKSCNFNLVVKGWQTNSDGSWGFSDSDSLNNELSTTTWIVPDTVLEAGDQSSQTDSLESQEADPSAELDPDIPDESAPSDDETTEGELTPTPTPEEVAPTPEVTNESLETLPISTEPTVDVTETPTQ